MTNETQLTMTSVRVIALYQNPETRKTSIPLMRYELSRNANWILPGGGVNEDETPQLTSQRILNQKIGLVENGLLELFTFQGYSCFFYIFAANIDSLHTHIPYATYKGKGIISRLFHLNEVERYLDSGIRLDGYKMSGSHEGTLRVAFEQIRQL